jgi:imidazolonepropionase-like amidohydrolase
LEEQIGSIQVGRDADLLLLDANPLDDAQNLTRVAAVYKSGVRVA